MEWGHLTNFSDFMNNRARYNQITRTTVRLLKANARNNKAIRLNPESRFIFRDKLAEGMEEIRVTPRPDLLGIGMMWTRIDEPDISGVRHGKSLWCRSDGVVLGRNETYVQQGAKLDDEPTTGVFFDLSRELKAKSFTIEMLAVASYLECKVPASEITSIPLPTHLGIQPPYQP